MSDDLSPMLSQPSDDNAPMISGRGTKIIADARGAYLVGNFNALVLRLNTDQQLRLHQEVVRGAIMHLRASMSYRDMTPHVTEFIEAAEHWLIHPTDESVESLLDLERIYLLVGGTGFNSPEALLSYFAWCVADSITHDAERNARNVAVISAIMQYQDVLTESALDELHASNDERVGHWHLDVAWAILRGAALPPTPTLITTLASTQHE